MKKIILVLMLLFCVNFAFAGSISQRKKVEIKTRADWSSYQILNAKLNNALVDIEDKGIYIKEMEEYLEQVENENHILSTYLNNRKPPETIIKQQIKKEIEEVEVLPWYWWVATVIALLI